MKLLRTVVWVLASITPVSGALARPFEVQAVYSVDSVAGAFTPALTESGRVPTDGLRPRADGSLAAATIQNLRLHLDRSNLGGIALGAMEQFTIVVTPGAGAKEQVIQVTEEELKSGKVDFTILPVDDSLFVNGAADLQVTIRIRAEPSSKLLCAAERFVRAKLGEERKERNPLFLGDYETPERKALYTKDPQGRKTEILFTFCAKDNVNWIAANTRGSASALGVQTEHDAEVKDEHKRRLFGMLLEDAPIQGLNVGEKLEVTLNPASKDATDTQQHTRVVVETKLTAWLLRTEGVVIVESLEPDAPGRFIDQNSRLAVIARSGRDGICSSWLFQRPFSMRVARLESAKGGSGPRAAFETTLEQAVNGKGGCLAEAPLDLRSVLGDTIVARYVHSFSPGQELIVSERTFTVRQIGWSATFPVFSEIVSATRAKSAKDFDATSSIPISWVFGLYNAPKGGVAVTFPVRLSYSPRDYPDLGKWLGAYAHASFIFPLEGESSSGKLAAGVGVSLFQFLNIAWAVKPGDSAGRAESYLLVGASITDIGKLAQ
jgi:hypothetical protein